MRNKPQKSPTDASTPDWETPGNLLAMTVLTSILVGVLAYLFYASELRSRIENQLFDLRTRLTPSMVPHQPVVMVTISNASAAALNPVATLSPWNVARPDDLSPEALLTLVQTLGLSNARMIAVLLPAQVFSYDDSRLDALTELARRDPRLMLGTFDQASSEGTPAAPNRLMLTAADHMFKTDIPRSFRRGIVRELVFDTPGDIPYLITHIAEQVNPTALNELRDSQDSTLTKLELNYAYHDQIPTVTAEAFMANPSTVDLQGAIVLVGYTGYRPLTFDVRESTFVNTPWQTEGDDLSLGMPVVEVQAIGLLNLLERTWLHPASLLFNVVQTVVIAALALAAWQFSIQVACLLFVLGWAALLCVHALLLAYAALHVPLADAVLWSALATITGAFLRLREELRLRAIQAEQLRSDKHLAASQDQFLNRFVHELARLNERILKTLRTLQPKVDRSSSGTAAVTGGSAVLAHSKALQSSEELAEYLAGMRQFASLSQTAPVASSLCRVALNEVIAEVLRQFETKASEARVAFAVQMPPRAHALADRTLTAQILFNLVSNAVKYSPPESTVLISITPHKQQILLSVTDQGKGIPPEFHDRIFEKFYRIKDDYVYKSKGHGLGLYLSRYFAKQMRAQLSLSSEVGKGSTFTLVLRRWQGA